MAYADKTTGKTYSSFEDYLKETGWTQAVGGGMFSKPTNTPTQSSAPSGLEPIVQGVQGVAGQIPGIQIGIDTLKGQQPLDIPEPDPVITPAIPTPTVSTDDPLAKAQEDYLASVKAPESTADEYEAAISDPDLKAKEQEVSDLTAQLNAINADAQAAMLTLEQQAGGKDVTSTFLGRQQQEISRQAAIKALPVAAQLEAAQGNLKTAQDHIDRLFEFKMADAKAQNDYNNRIAEIIYEFATENQQKQLDDKRTADDRAYNEKQDMVQRQWDLASTALKNNQGDLFEAITKLDENSLTFNEDLAELAGKIKAEEVEKMGQYGLTETQEKAFWTEINSGKNELQQGENWGSVWNRIKAQFPNVPNEAIDNALGGGIRKVMKDFPEEQMSRLVEEPWGWAKPAAYEEFKKKGKVESEVESEGDPIDNLLKKYGF